MTNTELLNAYRETIMEIEELQIQLEKATPAGQPSGCRSVSIGGPVGRTNDPMAAAMQLCDGLEKMIRNRRAALAEMSTGVCQLISQIANCRTLMIIQHYYLMAETDEQIGYLLGLSTTRVNQLRHKYLRTLDC